MGISLLKVSSACAGAIQPVSVTVKCACDAAPPAPPNPNPRSYEVLEAHRVGRALVVRVRYHGCTTFEGVKVLLYTDVSLEELLAPQHIDPHFSEDRRLPSPVARFEPSQSGWELALAVAKGIA